MGFIVRRSAVTYYIIANMLTGSRRHDADIGQPIKIKSNPVDVTRSNYEYFEN